jgi:uncharacterized protein
MNYWQNKSALITGASAGLGRELAAALATRGARLTMVARDLGRLEKTADELGLPAERRHLVAADVCLAGTGEEVVRAAIGHWGELDLVAHCAGKSMRGLALDTSRAEYEELLAVNFLAAVDLARASAAELAQRRGHLVLIGSLASKVAPKFLGAYPASKFALAAFAQQMRLEHGPQGLHTLLVCPGPLARDDAGERYNSADLPAAAQRPGGGARTKLIDPKWLAEEILRACESRRAELIVPAKAKLLFTLGAMSARWGDWLLGKQTGG